ncbi:hypothetical protein HB662_10185 [Roseomonas frigidaquae]|uniref:Uncharacterized protein n=1 Tax=Falsiroseomonas frigidaquae TaxID=487318 RepID=A0ABX1EYM0_9PROT|nr:hypothetical protein [Falsiroseomonas frigidaquae]NKE45148.1 hypothetical protein [Falsiroseomonas frigidaquae]
MKPTLIASNPPAETKADTDEIDLASLPRRVDRRAAADLVSRHFFPVSPRTVEAWPLTVRRVNGKALLEVQELMAFARAKLEAAPPVRGGRRTSTAA